MMTDFAKLVTFNSSFTFGRVSETRLTNRVYNWIALAMDILDNDYRFVGNYSYNQAGLAVSVNVCVYYKNEPLGCYDPFGEISLLQILNKEGIFTPTENQPSTFPSQPLNYYDEDYYDEGYYV
jgi:hypothetical protein